MYAHRIQLSLLDVNTTIWAILHFKKSIAITLFITFILLLLFEMFSLYPNCLQNYIYIYCSGICEGKTKLQILHYEIWLLFIFIHTGNYRGNYKLYNPTIWSQCLHFLNELKLYLGIFLLNLGFDEIYVKIELVESTKRMCKDLI